MHSIKILLAAMLAVACNKAPEVDTSFFLNPTSVTFPSRDAKPRTISVVTQAKWTAVPSDEWVKVTMREDGQSFDVTVDDNALPDKATEARKASVLISTSGNASKLTVIQKGDDQYIFNLLLENVKNSSIADANIDGAVRSAIWSMDNIKENGSFDDYDYTYTGVTWLQRGHWDRIFHMALSYVAPTSSLCGDEKLYDTIVKAITFWYKMNPQSTNWWENEIGWPKTAGRTMCLLRFGKKALPSDLEKSMVSRIMSLQVKGPQKYTGANKQDVALVWFFTGVLDSDRERLALAVDEFYQPMKPVIGEGLQHDFSYQQHGTQLYMGGYGAVVLNAYFLFTSCVRGTELENKEAADAIGNFLRYGYVPLHRGPYIFFSPGGRGHASRPGAVNDGSFAFELKKMAELDPTNAEFYTNAAERFSGAKPADYGVQPMHYHFWRSDYAVHQRPSYSMDFRTASTRTCRDENGNNENLKGYFLCEGCTALMVDGDEYLNIFPTWSWTHIPGTTVPDVADIPLPKAWGVPGQSNFTGGVSDGVYGCAVYKYTDTSFGINSSANKSWFCFDKEIVCLGSEVSSTNAAEIHTTVGQNIFKTGVSVELADGSSATMGNGEQSYSNLRWLSCDKTCYHFPENAEIKVRRGEAKGDWHDINNNNSGVISRNVFLAYINHGVSPQKEAYAYYVLPAQQSIAAAKSEMDKISYIRQDKVHAVYNENLKMIQAAFFEKGSFTLGGVTVVAANPCCLMITGIGSSAQLHVSDPSYRLSGASLDITLPGGTAKTVSVSFKTAEEERGKTEVITL